MGSTPAGVDFSCLILGAICMHPPPILPSCPGLGPAQVLILVPDNNRMDLIQLGLESTSVLPL